VKYRKIFEEYEGDSHAVAIAHEVLSSHMKHDPRGGGFDQFSYFNSTGEHNHPALHSDLESVGWNRHDTWNEGSDTWHVYHHPDVHSVELKVGHDKHNSATAYYRGRFTVRSK
jgi:hypothetical protein